jgi:FkbM family methyltransferase
MYYSELYDTPIHRKHTAFLHSIQRRLGVRELLRAFGHVGWVPRALRFRIIDCLYGTEYSDGEPFEVDFLGLRYPGTLNSFLDWTVYFFGAYEAESLLLLKDLLIKRASPVFLDIGANVGLFSVFLSRFSSQVHAFEPWCNVREAIHQKIQVNGIANIMVHPVALGEKDERLPFYAPRGANMGTGSFNSNHAADRNRLLGEFDVVNGDGYLRSHGISRVDVLKIDVEGWEKNVLLGLSDTLARDVPIVYMEVSETTLGTFGSIEEFRKCVSAGYQAEYVEFGRRGAEYFPFDCTRPGNVLLRVPATSRP